MRLFLSTWSVHRLLFDNAITIRQMPALAWALGFEGVELEDIFFESTQPSYIRQLRQIARKERCRVLIAISNDFTVKSQSEYKKQLLHTRRFLEIAAEFQSRPVRVLMGSKNSHKAALERVVRGFTSLKPLAKSLGVKLAIENHDQLSNKPETMLQVLGKVGKNRFGVCLDTGNLKSASRYDAIRRLAPYALMVHAKGYDFNSNGEETTIVYRRCFKLLNAARFVGPLVIEYDGPGGQIPGSMKTKAVVERYAKKL